MMDSVIAYLAQDQGLTSKEIADILWLTVLRRQLAGDLPTSVPGCANSEGQIKNGEDSRPESQQTDERDRTSSRASPPQPSPSPSSSAGLFPRKTTSRAITHLDGLPFKVTNATSVRDSLTLAKALRPLMRRVYSPTEGTLDEAATVQRIAEEQLWIPVTQPVLEPWLDLMLVVDESASMLIWQRTVLELRRLLCNQGTFRDVRLWGLGMKQDKVCLHPHMSSSGAASRTPEELLDPSGRRLLLLVTDCVSPIWHTRSLLDALSVWAEQGLMAILQVLPEWLWIRTALRQASPVQFYGLEPGTPNQKLSVIRRTRTLRREGDARQREIYVPILTLEPEMVLTWSQMVAGKGNARSPGFMFRPDLQSAFEGFYKDREEAELSPAQRVHRFRLVSSPMARRLAELVAATPVISLPVIRLIQETLLPRSSQVHVAEVLQGGLLQPKVGPQPETRADDIEYCFVDEGIGPELLKSAPVPDTVKVLSKYIKTQFGKSLDEFVAELRQWMESEDEALVERTRPFALVAAEVLRRKGGQYAEFVREVGQCFYRGRFEEIKNPYATYAEGKVVEDPQMFYGRDHLLNDLLSQIQNTALPRNFVIYGQKRTGKSSLLYHLKRQLQFPIIPVSFSIGEIIDNFSTTALLYRIIQRIEDEFEALADAGYPAIPVRRPSLEELEKNPQKFQDYMKGLRGYFRREERYHQVLLMLLIDDFAYIYTEIKRGQVANTFMKFWKSLLQQGRFGSVIFGHDLMFKFIEQFPNEFSVAGQIRIAYLDPDDAQNLIIDPIRIPDTGESRYRGNAVNRVMELTAGNPYYIQIFCDRLVKYMNRKKAIYVTDTDIDQVKEDLLSGNNALRLPQFDNLISAIDNGIDGITREDSEAVLREIAIGCRTQEYCDRGSINITNTSVLVDTILNDLCQREVLEKDRTSRFRIRVQLFKEWLLAN